MRLLFVLFIATVVEGRNKTPNLKENKPSSGNDDDEVNADIDIFEKKIDHPVAFGHIFIEGHEDPTSKLKQPLDLLELDMKYPKNSEEARSLLNENPEGVQMIDKKPPVVGSPRDEYLNRKEDKLPKDDTRSSRLKSRNDSAPMWFDLPVLQLRNKVSPKTPKFKNKAEKVVADLKKTLIQTVSEKQTKTKLFDNSFIPHRRPSISRKINWTKCDEFGKGAKFHPKDIVGVPWVPFFVWKNLRFLYVHLHTFSFPKKKVVKFYKDEYTPYLNITMDWTQPKLIMKFGKTEMLLIAADRRGLFDGIQRLDIPEYVKQNRVKLPIKRLRLKTVGPYLAMMYCDYNFAQILAVSGEEPSTPGKKLTEAKILNFRGRGGPVSRNLELEEMDAISERREKLAEEQSKFIIVDEPIPPLF